MKHVFRFWLLIVSLLLVGCGASLNGTTFAAPESAPDISLTSTDGAPFRISEQRGKVLLIFYGFTSCPDICPTTLSDLANAYRRLNEREAEQVQVVMVTVDPERDTPERLARYVTSFHPSFMGVTGTQAEIEAAMQPYGVYAERRDLPNSALGYTMDHSPYVYVIDRAGNWREFFGMEDTPEEIASDLALLAREQP